LASIDFSNTTFYMTKTVYDEDLSNDENELYKPIMTREQHGKIINEKSFNCTGEDCFREDIFLTAAVWNFPSIDLTKFHWFDKLVKIENNPLYDDIGVINDKQNTIVVFPETSLYAYSKPCIWDYYLETTTECFTVNMLSDSEKRFQYYEGAIVKQHVFDPTKPDPLNYFAFHQRAMNLSDYDFSPTIMHYSSNLGAQTLHLLGYEFISDLEIEKNPQVLSNYDKVIMLHSKYVTKTMFDAITSHPKVVYFFPDSLVEEIKVDFSKNEMIVLNPLKFPGEKNFPNDFKWKYDSEHQKYVDCNDTIEIKFEKVGNGIMLNCYPENIILIKTPELFKMIKEF